MQKPVSPPIDPSSTVAARYEILGSIGRGATGSVFQAYDHALFRMVALKALDTDATELARRSFERERAALSRLQHENVVTLFDCRPRSQKPFMALSYHEGPSLDSVISRGPLTSREAAALGHEISRALDHVHSRGFVYRDLKPENVLIDGERVVLIDFGTAIEIGLDDAEREVAGTLGFMAPEQYDAQRVDPRCDVFGLGALLYESVLRTTPYGVFAKRRRCIRPHRYVHPSDAHEGLDPGLAEVIHRCLALEPNERYQSSRDLREALSEVVQSLSMRDPRLILRELVERPNP